MAKAVWNGIVIAESKQTKVIEGNHYFPPDSVNHQFLRESSKHTVCPWKGVASYYTVEVGGQQITDGAWFYPAPKDAAKDIADHIAFWRGVRVEA
jgi:uncharacterized protein (DUF427 family)